MSLDRDNSFELTEELGGGGFATTYLARIVNPKIIKKWNCDDIVVIKFPNDEDSSIDLSKEIELNNAIKTNSSDYQMKFLCKIYGVSIFKSDFGSKLVMIMEYMPEGNLRKKIQTSKLDLDTIIQYIKGILSGLDVIHNNKIIHRDIKPENILFKNNIPRIADLGIGKALHSQEHADSMVGTLYYMSPEILMGKGATYNTDIWSLGVMFHELLFGQLPFGIQYNHAQGQIVTAIVNSQKIELPVKKGIPEGLNEVLKKSLEKDVNKRYQSAREMLCDIEHYEASLLKESDAYKEAVEKKNSKDYEGAIKMFNILIEKYPACSDLYIDLGRIYENISKIDMALDIYKKGLENDPGSGNLYFALGILSNNIKESDKAIEYFTESINCGISNRNTIIAKTLIQKLKKQ